MTCVRSHESITDKNKKLGSEAFGEINDMMRELVAGGVLKDQPPAFAAAIMSAIADVTMDFIAREPAKAKQHTKAGLEAFCKAVTM